MSPVVDRAKRLAQAPRLVGQLVLDAQRHLGEDGAVDEVLILESPQCFHQHLVGDTLDGAAKLAVTPRTSTQGLQDRQAPPPSQQCNDAPSIRREDLCDALVVRWRAEHVPGREPRS